jgi:hypothetical protein
MAPARAPLQAGPMPLAAPPPPPRASVDAPPPTGAPVDLLDLVGRPTPHSAGPAPRRADAHLAARIGLVLSLVLALAGVASAIAKSGDDGGGSPATAGIDVADDPSPSTTAATAAEDDPLAASTPAEAPPGFEIRQGDGLSLAVPSEWRSLDKESIGRLVDGDRLADVFPDLDESMAAAVARAVDGGVVFMAIDASGADAGRNINVLRVSGAAPLGMVEASLEQQLAQAGIPAEVLGTERRDTPLGRALRVHFVETVGEDDVQVVQYYVPFDGETYIVTGTATDDVVDQAIQTLRVGDTV